MRDIQKVVDGYVECALWASLDDEGEPLDNLYGPGAISDETMQLINRDVAEFLRYCDRERINSEKLSDEQMGHDFWLTRNHHGAGFWDRGLGALGESLTRAAHTFGDAHLYIDDEGSIRQT